MVMLMTNHINYAVLSHIILLRILDCNVLQKHRLWLPKHPHAESSLIHVPIPRATCFYHTFVCGISNNIRGVFLVDFESTVWNSNFKRPHNIMRTRIYTFLIWFFNLVTILVGKMDYINYSLDQLEYTKTLEKH